MSAVKMLLGVGGSICNQTLDQTPHLATSLLSSFGGTDKVEICKILFQTIIKKCNAFTTLLEEMRLKSDSLQQSSLKKIRETLFCAKSHTDGNLSFVSPPVMTFKNHQQNPLKDAGGHAKQTES